MKNYKRRFQQWWMDTDQKPNRKVRRLIEKQNRIEERETIRKELNEALSEDEQIQKVKVCNTLDEI